MPCTSPCLTCSISASNCSSCNLTNKFILSGNQCVCSAGYYNSGGVCTACSSPCVTCSGSTICTSCNLTKHFVLTGSSCQCQAGYMLSNSDLNLCVQQNTTCQAGYHLNNMTNQC